MSAYADRVCESTATTGPGTLNLGGAQTNFQSFTSAFVSGQRVRYSITGGTDWETGDGVFTTGSPATLTRENVYASSNSGALVSLASVGHIVFADLPAQSIADIGLTTMLAGNMVIR